jgi:hypothetical protein
MTKIKGLFCFGLIILFISCSNYVTKLKSNYIRDEKEYKNLHRYFYGIENSSCNSVSFRNRKELGIIDIHVEDSVSNYIISIDYNVKNGDFEKGVDFSCNYSIDTLLSFFQKTNCSVIEWKSQSLFIGFGGNIKSKNAEFESGILICNKGFLQILGHLIEKINDTVFVYEKRVL